MSKVAAGTKVKINENTTGRFHAFTEGQVVVSVGIDFPDHHQGDWSRFTRESDGMLQWLLPEHYTVVVEAVAEEQEEVVDTVGRSKAVYAVLNDSDEIIATTADRDFARELKSALGGKRKGVRIFQYAAAKEIR